MEALRVVWSSRTHRRGFTDTSKENQVQFVPEGAGGKIRETAKRTISMEQDEAIHGEGPWVRKTWGLSASAVSRLKTAVQSGDQGSRTGELAPHNATPQNSVAYDQEHFLFVHRSGVELMEVILCSGLQGGFRPAPRVSHPLWTSR